MLLLLLLLLLVLAFVIFLPFRAKNPPEHFPVVTVGLIIVNALVFALTSRYFLVARESAVERFGVSHDTLSLPRLLSSMFLHGSLLHLAGNMLFLWIFGASVEGRLRPARFLLTYFLCGLGGGLLHDLVVGIHRPEQFMLGASGAIMGLAGAYLYMFPFSTICVFWCVCFVRFGVLLAQARWIVLLYVGLDLVQGIAFQDGTAHFAHLGGAGIGLLMAWILKARRDAEEFSTAQAMVSDMRDFSLMSLYELEPLMRQATPEPRLVLTFCQKALLAPGLHGEQKCVDALHQHGKLLVKQGDAAGVTAILLHLPLTAVAANLPLVFFLRLGSRLEREGQSDLAVRIYRRILEINMSAPDAEVALYRIGRLMEQTYRDAAGARAYYEEILRRFPNGSLAFEADRCLANLDAQRVAARPAHS